VLLIFTDMIGDAFDGWLVPVLGFFLLPWTTLAYALMWSAGGNGVIGFEWFIVVLAFFFDIASHSKGVNYRENR
jgi:hypothetical protein